MRFCLIYDRLYPLTIGGAERWLTELAGDLAAQGHDVTYLTLRHWDRSVEPSVEGVHVIAFGPRLDPYGKARRRFAPPIIFGARVLIHLIRNRRRYDAVHVLSFPYLSTLAAGLFRRFGGYRLVVTWVEVWPLKYWRTYVGTTVGFMGWFIQRLCIASTTRAQCFSRLHAERLRAEGFKGEITLISGLYGGTGNPQLAVPNPPVAVYAGRHIPDKQVPALVAAVAHARVEMPELRCEIYGDGPEIEAVRDAVHQYHLEDRVTIHGFVDPATVDQAIGAASCFVLASRREGFGLVVVEAAARATPSVVVRGEDNAAVELVADGENGVVAASASPEDLSVAIRQAVLGGESLRRSTAAWFLRNEERFSARHSLDRILADYR